MRLAVLLWAVHAIGALAAVLHVVRSYRNPTAAIGWLFAVAFLPLIGPLTYLALAVYSGPRGVRQRRQDAAAVRHSRRYRIERPDDAIAASGLDARFMATMERAFDSPLVGGNSVELCTETPLQDMLDAIGGAREEVLLQTYVLKPGAVYDRLLPVLAGRAAAGVRVRLLVDPIGSMDLPRERREELRAHGIAIDEFLRPQPFKGRFQVNFRNHRKSLCIDGWLAFTGGRNWADEYFAEVQGEGAHRDTTVRVAGPVVPMLRRMLLEDLAIAADDPSLLEGPAPVARPCGDVPVRVLAFGPDEARGGPLDVLGAACAGARERLVVATPYFIPGDILRQQLRSAAFGGVDVEVLVPMRSGYRAIDRIARYHMAPLLEAGVRVRRVPPPLLHAKAVLVDDRWATVGSLNLDARSLRLNYELNLEVLSADLVRDVDAYLDRQRAASRELTARAFARRSKRARFAEKASALFEQLL